uniref:Uncharacterized protein n=1 Tax=Arundo donax TaxID=35708 RepID=A0A0A9GAS7_ARUDO
MQNLIIYLVLQVAFVGLASNVMQTNACKIFLGKKNVCKIYNSLVSCACHWRALGFI